MKKIYNILHNSNRKYEGSHYAITAEGGFHIAKSEIAIPMKLDIFSEIGKYYVSDAIQVKFSAETLNSKLNGYNYDSGKFSEDSIEISADEFISLENSDIISLGDFSNSYSEYIRFINNKCNFAVGGISIFSSDSQSKLSSIINAEEFLDWIRQSYMDDFGITQNILKGKVSIFNVNNMLEKMNNINIFGNRENTQSISGGFLAGDLIYFKDGLSMNMYISTDSVINGNILNELQLMFDIKQINSPDLSRKFTSDILIRLV